MFLHVTDSQSLTGGLSHSADKSTLQIVSSNQPRLCRGKRLHLGNLANSEHRNTLLNLTLGRRQPDLTEESESIHKKKHTIPFYAFGH